MHNYVDAKEKLDAVQKLFSEQTTTIGKLRTVSSILSGIHPRMDKLLIEYDKHLSRLQNIEEGDVVELSAEVLPEKTEQERKRKAIFLLFLRYRRQLENEVARVEAELERDNSEGNQNTSMWRNILSTVKGPIGLVTIIAIGIAVLQVSAVEISIHNKGCDTIQPRISLPVALPGLSLPKEPIFDGQTAMAVIPPLPLDVDGTEPGRLSISSLGLNLSFEFSSGNDVILDGVSLIGVKTRINLSGEGNHMLTLVCR